MTITASKLKAGDILSIDGQLAKVIHSEYHSSGKMVTSVNSKLKNIKTGTLIEKHFKPDERLEEIHLDKKDYEFLYMDRDEYYFMDPETYDQINLSLDMLGMGAESLKPNSRIVILFFEEKAVGAVMPESMELRVTLTSPAQQQSSSTMKSATLENGRDVLVPSFIKTGDLIKVELQTNKYLERIKEKDEKRVF